MGDALLSFLSCEIRPWFECEQVVIVYLLALMGVSIDDLAGPTLSIGFFYLPVSSLFGSLKAGCGFYFTCINPNPDIHISKMFQNVATTWTFRVSAGHMRL